MRRRLDPVQHQDPTGSVELHCLHETVWPPTHASLPDSFEVQRANGEITETEYQRLLVWRNNCGIKAMNAAQCSICPHARVEGTDGKMHAYVQKPGSRPPPFIRSIR
jgi:hypothetical protein